MICEICNFEFNTEFDYDFCSAFCSELSPTDLENFKKLQLGEFGYWPCPGCGCVVEGDFPGKDGSDKNTMCSDCYTKTRLKVRTELLNKLVQSKYFPGSDLVYEIEEELSK